jgi:hypothetical protein
MQIVQKKNRIFDSLQFYKIICVFIQLYRGCFIDYINAQMMEQVPGEMS